MLSPCAVRWIKYDDYYTGTELLGACLASFEKESPSAATSCGGGLSGLGEEGDGRVPRLIGVGCVDMNLIVDLPTLEAPSSHGHKSAGVLAAPRPRPCLATTVSSSGCFGRLRALQGAHSVPRLALKGRGIGARHRHGHRPPPHRA